MAKQCATVIDKQGNIDSVILKNYDNTTPLERAVKRNKGYSLDKASNGEPSLLYQFYTDEMNMSPEEAEFVVANTFSTEFGDWFGRWWEDGADASKVVDTNGQPKPVWSGQLAHSKFDGTYKGYEENYIEDGYERFSRSAFFLEDKYDALSYATALSIRDEKTLKMYQKFLPQGYHHEPVFLNIKNIKKIDSIGYETIMPLIPESKEKGIDGFEGKTTSAFGTQVNSWVISSGSQVVPLSEMEEVSDRMKAPNGEDSNLTNDQWSYVRTEEFKDFFGDWETDPENSSKILDENGEPQVVYHGTNKEFETFEGVKIQGKELSFFSTDLEYAQAHSMKNENGGKSIVKEVFLNIRNPIEKNDINTLTVVKDIKAKPDMKNDGFIGTDKITERNVIVTTSIEQIMASDSFDTNSQTIGNIVENAIDRVQGTEDQIDTVKEVLSDINQNMVDRLGITVEEYLENNKTTFKETQPSTPQQVLDIYNEVFMENNSVEDKEMTTLNQPNQNLKKPFESDPKVKKLELDLSTDENQWTAKFLTKTESGKALLGKLGKNPTAEQVEDAMEEQFEMLGEEIRGTDKYYMTEISDKYIDYQIQKANAESNSEREDMWNDVKRNKERYIEQTKNDQKANLKSIYDYYENAFEYPMGMKLMILDRILAYEYTYDFQNDKISKPSKRDNSTMSLHFTPNSIFMNKVIDKGLSDNNILHDYFYEAANFKGEKINLAYYKSNVHRTTSTGTWYKFENKNPRDGELFYNMSRLSAAYPGAWCTGGSDSTARNYLQRGDMYIFFDNIENNPTLQIHLKHNEEVQEIGGLLSGQGVREQDMNNLEEFKNAEKNINFKEIEDYLKYSKVTSKWIKSDRDINNLTKEELMIILESKDYSKDNTGNLEKIKSQFTVREYSKIYGLEENEIEMNPISIYNVNELSKKLYLEYVDFENIYSDYVEIPGNITFNKELSISYFGGKNITIPETVLINGKLKIDNFSGNDLNILNKFGSNSELSVNVFGGRNLNISENNTYNKASFDYFSGNDLNIPENSIFEKYISIEFFDGRNLNIPSSSTYNGNINLEYFRGGNLNIEENAVFKGGVYLDNYESEVLTIPGNVTFEDYLHIDKFKGRDLNISSDNNFEEYTSIQQFKGENLSIGDNIIFKKPLNIRNFEKGILKIGNQNKLNNIMLNEFTGDTATIGSDNVFTHELYLEYFGGKEKTGALKIYTEILNPNSKLEIMNNNRFGDEVKLSKFKGESIKIGENNQFTSYVDFEEVEGKKIEIGDNTVFEKFAILLLDDKLDNKISESVKFKGDVVYKKLQEDGNYKKVLNQDNRGTIVKTKDKSLTIFSKESDITTIIHEKAHEYEDVLTQKEVDTLEQWSGYKKGTVEFSEAFAKGAEKAIHGNLVGNTEVNSIFQKLAEWFQDLIKDAFDYFEDLNEMNPDVINIYRKMMLRQGFEQIDISESNSDNMMNGVEVQQNEFIPSQLFEELSQQPFMTKEQALDIYQHIYTEGLNEWKDNDMTC